LLLIPVYFITHPAASQMARGFALPVLPGGSGQLSTVMLLIIAIVGTTVAPWQLFFQQSYVIDKRITPRFIRYEKADLWIGIAIVITGAAAIMGFTTAAFAGHPGSGHFTNAAGIAAGLQAQAGRATGVLFAVALLDASVIGAFAVSLATAYAIGDVLGLRHSLHRGVKGAKGFYAVYGGLVAAAATVVLLPGSPLGLLTEGVQTLAGVLLPSATVFLLLLCNDAGAGSGSPPSGEHPRRHHRVDPGAAIAGTDGSDLLPGPDHQHLRDWIRCGRRDGDRRGVSDRAVPPPRRPPTGRTGRGAAR
jgi:Mn2+/Fe2+ NRAMP family transporter